MWEGNFVLAAFIVLLVAVLTSTIIAVATERIAYRPLRGSPRLI
ncbi:MAG: branched-chain amino acid ABC transporter permease, partial [Gemmatimonadetes bacterium]|nr:branched-chain amino acid ABC transporter permease [Gemmatimonadota bacterium]